MNFLPKSNTLNNLKQAASGLIQYFEDLQEPQYSTFWTAELPSLANESNIEIPKVLSVDSVPMPSISVKPYRVKGMSAPFADRRNAYTPIKIKVYNNSNNCGISYGNAWMNLSGNKNGEFNYPSEYCKEFILKLVDKMGFEVMTITYMCWMSDITIPQLNYDASKDTNISYTLQVIDMKMSVSVNVLSKVKNSVAKLPSIFADKATSMVSYFGDLTVKADSLSSVNQKQNFFKSVKPPKK